MRRRRLMSGQDSSTPERYQFALSGPVLGSWPSWLVLKAVLASLVAISVMVKARRAETPFRSPSTHRLGPKWCHGRHHVHADVFDPSRDNRHRLSSQLAARQCERAHRVKRNRLHPRCTTGTGVPSHHPALCPHTRHTDHNVGVPSGPDGITTPWRNRRQGRRP